MEIRMVKTAADVEFCRKAIFEFRPQVDQQYYIEQVMEMIIDDGFKLIYITNEDNTSAASILGYRTYTMLRTERMIYIDDLFTFEQYRGQGYAGALLDFVEKEARRQGIGSIHLDSGFQLHPAHKVYLNKGYVLACHHFAKIIR